MGNTLNRRDFIARSLAAAPAAAVAARMVSAGAAETAKSPEVLIFSKYLQLLDYKALAKTCREVGVDGVDLTVRPGGHVEPENVDRDLPAAVEAIRAEGLSVPMITTKYTDVRGPNVKGVFAAAAKLGIPFVRVGSHQYDDRGEIAPQIAKFTEDMRGLAAEAEAAGVTLGYHVHSGGNNFGAAVWDLLQAVEAVDSPRLGFNFDTGHTRVEGGYYAWNLHARRLASRVKMLAVKDFVWDGGQPKWVPLGEGIVESAEAIGILRTLGGYAGPVSLQIEYKVASDGAMIEEIRKSVPVLRKILRQAGYPA